MFTITALIIAAIVAAFYIGSKVHGRTSPKQECKALASEAIEKGKSEGMPDQIISLLEGVRDGEPIDPRSVRSSLKSYLSKDSEDWRYLLLMKALESFVQDPIKRAAISIVLNKVGYRLAPIVREKVVEEVHVTETRLKPVVEEVE